MPPAGGHHHQTMAAVTDYLWMVRHIIGMGFQPPLPARPPIHTDLALY